MKTAATTKKTRSACAHCGLPLTASSSSAACSSSAPWQAAAADLFCCHACRMVAAIIGKHEQGEHSWNLLRLGFGALLAMNVMMISLLLYTQSVDPPTVPAFRLLLLALSALALAILMPPFLAGAARELTAKRLSLDTLIALGSLSAFSVSALNVLHGTGEIYFDTATMLPILVTVGKIIEASAKTRAADLLRSLESLLPPTALRVTSSGTAEVSLDLLRPGDLVRVRPGERVAVDGSIMEGTSSIEEAAFSGEFLPRTCRPGDRVIAGTVNGAGPLLLQAEKTGEELLLHGIIDMIQDAWRTPSGAERIAQRAAALFIPAVVIIAAAAILGWTLSGDASRGLLSALSVLVVACPCTIGIATPLATSLAIARAAKAGIVVRGGGAIERLASIDLVFFDKTGTVTLGSPALQSVVSIDPLVSAQELLARVAALEEASEHALGRAAVKEARERGIKPGVASQLEVCPGSGIGGMVTWRGVAKKVVAGSAAFVALETDRQAATGSSSVIDVAWDGELRGRLLFSDPVRPDAAQCVEALAKRGVASVLLSGDGRSAAAAVAEQVGILMVDAPRTPAEKREAISIASAAGRSVAMVGDGINDAPALAAAQAGMALGAAMDLAKQAGDVVLLSGQLMQIPWLIDLGRQTVKIVRGNFAWSFGYNGLALAAAAAGWLHPLLAAAAMVVSSLTVLGNSLRIAAYPDPDPDPDPGPAPSALGSTHE